MKTTKQDAFSKMHLADAFKRFYDCQRHAIETIVYCHEILYRPALKDLIESVISEALMMHLPLKQDMEIISFPKYTLKMAAGSGQAG